jgi:CRISPR-associated protein Cas1
MRLQDLHLLPKFRDGLSYLYVEHCKVEQDSKSIAIFNEAGKVPIPCASLSVLMLGPGTSITHAAIQSLADNGCLAIWCGEEGVRFYAQGMGESRHARKLIQQAILASNRKSRQRIVRKMYEMRFHFKLDEHLSIQQIRGMEGIRVKNAYRKASEATGIEWSGRSYDRGSWERADPVNRALSTANSCLYGICHAGIVSLGYSPALGFIHTGKQLSFVYDIADLYKADLTIPLAFHVASQFASKLETQVRHFCREYFRENRLLARIVADLETLMAPEPGEVNEEGVPDYDSDMARPGELWDPTGNVEGGVNFSEMFRPKGEESNDGSDS